MDYTVTNAGPRFNAWVMHMDEDPRVEKRKARWLRNKRAAREKLRAMSSPAQVVREMPPDLLAAVFAERDRRASETATSELWRGSYFWEVAIAERAVAFVADVWAAKTLIEWQHGAASAGQIHRWLVNERRLHGYKEASMRVRVYNALKRLAVAETERWHECPQWKTFDLSRWEGACSGECD